MTVTVTFRVTVLSRQSISYYLFIFEFCSQTQNQITAILAMGDSSVCNLFLTVLLFLTISGKLNRKMMN